MIYVIYNGAYSGPQVDAAVSRALAGGAIDQAIEALRASVGSPLTAATAADMTDTRRIYVYTGTEAGYTAGNWYYFDGAAWTSGGVYNAVAVDMALSDSSDNAVANRIVKAAIDANAAAIAAAAETAAYALAAFPTETDAGAVAHTDVGADGVPVKALSTLFEATQSGSGDPSPGNVRPIVGRTDASIVVSPTLDAQDGTTTTVNWTDEVGAVFGGLLELNSDGTWTLTVTHTLILGSDLTGAWTKQSDYAHTFYHAVTSTVGAPNKARGLLNVMSNSYRTDDTRDNNTVCGSTANTRIYVTDETCTTVEEFEAEVANVQFCYELSTPLVYTLNSAAVKSFLGATNVWADTGDVSVTFRCDPALYIDARIGGAITDAIGGEY